MKQEPLSPQRIRKYITLQALTLVGCWIWFAVLWSIAFFGYTLGDIEWWMLVGAGCAGLGGLRPNLERAIDTAWLQDVKTSAALADRVAQLKPIKRRIDIYFSVIVLVLFLVGVLLWVGFFMFNPDLQGSLQGGGA